MAVNKHDAGNLDIIPLKLPTETIRNLQGFEFEHGAKLLVNTKLHEDSYDDNAINNIANWLYERFDGEISRLDDYIKGVEQLGDYAGSYASYTALLEAAGDVDADGNITHPLTGDSIRLTPNDFVTVRYNDNPANDPEISGTYDTDAFGKQVRYVVQSINPSTKAVTWVLDIVYSTDLTDLMADLEGLVNQANEIAAGKMDKLDGWEDNSTTPGRLIISKSDGNAEVSSATVADLANKTISYQLPVAFSTDEVRVSVTQTFTQNGIGNAISNWKSGETLVSDTNGTIAVVTNTSNVSPNNATITYTVLSTSGFEDASGKGDYVRSVDAQGAKSWTSLAELELESDKYVRKAGDIMTGGLYFKNVGDVTRDSSGKNDAVNSGNAKFVIQDTGKLSSPNKVVVDISGQVAGDTLQIEADKTVFRTCSGIQIGSNIGWGTSPGIQLGRAYPEGVHSGYSIEFNVGNQNLINFPSVGNTIIFGGNSGLENFPSHLGSDNNIDFRGSGASWIYFRPTTDAFAQGDKRFGRDPIDGLVRQTYNGSTWVTDPSDSGSATDWEAFDLTTGQPVLQP